MSLASLIDRTPLPVAAAQRFMTLAREAGPKSTLAFLASVVDDRYLGRFDREYRVATSGFINLEDTSFSPARLRDATLYGPVNGWAFRRFLRKFAPPKQHRFADLGCGLGRACILAAEYGFDSVTGVDLAPELCARARVNIARSRISRQARSAITILEMDALEYCETSYDDIFFMYRPFSRDFFRRILGVLKTRAQERQLPITVIYTERVALPGSFFHILTEDASFRRVYETASWAQVFQAYQVG